MQRKTNGKRKAAETQLGRRLMSFSIMPRKTDECSWNRRYCSLLSAEDHCSLVLLSIF